MPWIEIWVKEKSKTGFRRAKYAPLKQPVQIFVSRGVEFFFFLADSRCSTSMSCWAFFNKENKAPQKGPGVAKVACPSSVF